MNWRAIGIAVVVGLVGSMTLGVVWRAFPPDAESIPLWLIVMLSYATGALLDIATGAVAGALARTRGAVHGLVAGAITAALSPLIALAMMLVQGKGTLPLPLGDYLVAILPSSLIGIALAAVAGEVAARIAARRVAG